MTYHASSLSRALIFSFQSSGSHRDLHFPDTTLFRSTNRLTVKPRGTYSAWPAMRIVSCPPSGGGGGGGGGHVLSSADMRSEEHTSELQSRSDLVCSLLLEKKQKKTHTYAESSAAMTS